MKGTISISHNGNIIQQLQFRDEWNRTRIIEKWKKMYGKGFKNAEVSEVIEESETKRDKSRYEK